MPALEKVDYEQALIEDIAKFFSDPLGFVRYAWDWGHGTLADETGPDEWQAAVLTEIGEAIRDGASVGDAIRLAVASGHGVGKSCLVAWLIIWFVSTREFPQVLVTAGTQAQLSTKTWRELAKWHRLAINAHWFSWTATRFSHVEYPETWFAAAIPWSEHNRDAFAGTHERYVLVIYDEASAIADSIWEVTEGAMTTPGAIWLAFGNPTQNTGRFKECFGRFRHRWRCKQVDSRTAKKANRSELDKWVADYGEDSDFVRVRVRGVFPRAGSNQWIGADLIALAKSRRPQGYENTAKVLGVDVARHGDDESCFSFRHGQKLIKQIRFRITDLMQLASKVAEAIDAWHPDATFIDATGIGWGVYDRLRQLGYDDVLAVQTGESAEEDQKYYNRRMELWARMRDWLKDGGAIPEDNQLSVDLEGPVYGFDGRERLQLERKEDMKKRGLASPDGADSLALTFAERVAPRTMKQAPLMSTYGILDNVVGM